jgi:uncharacterized protein YrrD
MDKDKTLKDDETSALISADKVSGTAVHTPAGEKLGTIENVMIDKVSGQVEYAVLAFGGLLGMGKGRRALPWDVLTYDTNQNAYVVNLDPQILKDAPSYDDSESAFDWGNRESRRELDDYYRL